MIGDRRIRLDIKKLEGMSKIRSYYLASIKNGLSHYGKDLNSTELKEIANISAVGEIIDLGEDDDLDDDLLLEEEGETETETQRTNLVLEDIIDLTQSFDNIESVALENDNIDERNGNMDFDPIALVNQILINE